MIQIKAYFGDWKPADKEQATKFVRRMLSSIGYGTYEDKIARIEEKHLRGITVRGLLM